VTDFVHVYFYFFFNYFVVLPVMVNKDFHYLLSFTSFNIIFVSWYIFIASFFCQLISRFSEFKFLDPVCLVCLVAKFSLFGNG